MVSPRNRRRPTLDVLEDRVVLTAAASNTLGVGLGTVAAPRELADVSFPVSARNIGGRTSIELGVSITTTAGSALQPTAVAAYGPNGQRLKVAPGAPFVPGGHDADLLYVIDGTPGPVTIAVTGKNGTTGAFQVEGYLPGDVNGDGQVTAADETAFVKVYGATTRAPDYNPLADANRNGQIGQDDGKLLLRNLTVPGPQVPLFITTSLSPSQLAAAGHSQTSGGVTYDETVTIHGKTVPGSIVFTDSSAGNYKFTGKPLVADAQGNFQVTVKNTSGINNNDFLVIDPELQQKIFDYPIYWSAYAAPGSKLGHTPGVDG